MPKLPRLTGKEMVRFLEARGFTVTHVRGSHHFLDSPTHRTSVPVHGNAALKIGTLRSILRDIALSPTDFFEAWQDQ